MREKEKKRKREKEKKEKRKKKREKSLRGGAPIRQTQTELDLRYAVARFANCLFPTFHASRWWILTRRWDADRDRLPTTCVLATRHVAALQACTGIVYRRYHHVDRYSPHCHSPYAEQRFAHRSSIMLPVKDGRESLNMANLLATEHPISHASSSLTSDKHFSLALEAERSEKNKIRCVSEAKQSSNGNDKRQTTLMQ
ncbi:uncharacterized protein UHO2_03168 [Ustilago hordei]|uniref:Uncharacterized protein n=1 Tax=Ustilago hordei TaxID=120017 RepID=I2FZD9_USTHO|nr:uncharacterized protein UHO2_03168 [Ustilago hordei]CCF52282.1 uncharacterized protein UHOR_15370 [Ustilago hordei]SYW83952.1 uncharacterized protein UHO2_03168 [Ustilago hordei]